MQGVEECCLHKPKSLDEKEGRREEMSLMKVMNRSGRMIDPWGTPERTGRDGVADPD